MIRHPDEDRTREAFDKRLRQAGTRNDCPEPDRIWDAVAGSLPLEQLDEITAHATTCSSCAEDWRLALDMSREHVRPARATPPWIRWALPVAAMIVLGLLVVPMWRSIDRTDPAEFRSEPADVTIRSLLPEDGPLDRNDCVLRWSGPAGAVYDVVVTAEDTTILTRISNLQESEFRVGPERIESVPDGGTIVWHVQARSPDGSRPGSLTVRSRIGATGP